MADFGGDLTQRDQDEIPLGQPRMRDDEVRQVDGEAIGEKDVDVDRPGALGYGRDAFHPGLDRFCEPEKGMRF